MTLRKLLFCGAACGLAFLASCSSNTEEDNEVATQVADGTLPPWLAESGDGAAYTAVSSDSPTTYKSKRTSSSTSPKATSSKASSRSGKSSSKAVASRSGKKSASSKSKKSAPKASYYTVKKGDSIDKIARRYKCSNKSLMKANGLKSDLIHPGKKLRIP